MEHKWIICDLDGTLCNTEHRDHHARAREWDEFNSKLIHDTPNEAVVTMLRAVRTYWPNVKAMALTARSGSMVEETTDWLAARGLYQLFDTIRMRPMHDKSSDADLKPKMLFDFFGSKEEALRRVMVILDDRDRVVNAFREHGFTVWQVKAGAY